MLFTTLDRMVRAVMANDTRLELAVPSRNGQPLAATSTVNFTWQEWLADPNDAPCALREVGCPGCHTSTGRTAGGCCAEWRTSRRPGACCETA